jgi:hypothetical protein
MAGSWRASNYYSSSTKNINQLSFYEVSTMLNSGFLCLLMKKISFT